MAWLICKVIIWICSAVGIDDSDLHAIAIVTVFDVLMVFYICNVSSMYEGDGAAIATGGIFAAIFIFLLTVLDVNLIKEAWKRKQRNERKKVKKIETYIESLEKILEAVEDLRDEENDLLDGMPDNLRHTRQHERAAK